MIKTRMLTKMLPQKLVAAKSDRMIPNKILHVYAMLHARNTFAFFRDIILLIITIMWSGSGRENNGQQGHLGAFTPLIHRELKKENIIRARTREHEELHTELWIFLGKCVVARRSDGQGKLARRRGATKKREISRTSSPINNLHF